jgi:hypothetical protein
VRLLVDELVDPELELPRPTVIRLLCRRDIRFLFCFSSDSSMSSWMVATIGACRRGERRMRLCQYVRLRGRRRRECFLWHARVLAFDSDYLRVDLRPLRIARESEVVVPAGWHAARHLGSAPGNVLWDRAYCWERDFGDGIWNVRILAHRTGALIKP